ncbi:neuroligin-4, X-linked-like [Panonychus citri]|uniref:neuroligin-4, X-linked-like n=1 Tax=Panonychus citri TaxID=50023 RepID=UPI00230755F9|nr:neuroligin-4, X-linked-like [Panonychus citri]
MDKIKFKSQLSSISIQQLSVNIQQVKFILIISLTTNLIVLWLNCVSVLADFTQNKRPSTRIVTTKYGSLRGVHINLPHNLQPVEMFLGIPYASPPTGKLRFMPPVTPAHWSGIRNSDKHGHVCPQNLPNITNEPETLRRMTRDRLFQLKRLIPLLQNQSEDCLYLNIYTPAPKESSSSSPSSPHHHQNHHRHPVVVFIHGESYEWNSGSVYDGSVLSSFGNLIVVTINYRLGVLGFYPAMDGSSRGNFGLMDQVAALHWVQENIIEFGGDPSNVTIHGHGHGAALVNLLMLSPMAKGLFHRAIMQSGSALCPWALAFNAIKYGREYAQAIGCYSEESKSSNIVDCLRHKTIAELLSVQIATPRFLTGFGPMVDGIIVASDPLTMMNDPTSTFSSYNLIIGVTRLESYNLFSSIDFDEGLNESRRDKIIRTLVRNIYTYHLQEIYLTISNEYTEWSQSNPNNQLTLESLTELLSDALFVGPVVKTALIHSKSTKATKLYYFSHTSNLMLTNHSRLVSVHGQDLPYALGTYLLPEYHPVNNHSRIDLILSEIMMKYWSNFIRDGDPNGKTNTTSTLISNGQESRSESNHHWPSYDYLQQQYLVLNTKLKLKDHYHAHRLSYWLNLIPKLHSPGSSAFGDHHFLEDHDNLVTYDGHVRSSVLVANSGLDRVPELPANRTELMIYGKTESSLKHRVSLSGGGYMNESQSDMISSTGHSGSVKGALNKQSGDSSNGTFSMIIQDNPYSKALSVTIAVGCSLLILNILVFAGVFLHRDRTYRSGQNPRWVNRSNCPSDTRPIHYKQTSRVKFTKVNDDQGPNCIQYCHHTIGQPTADNLITSNTCTGYDNHSHPTQYQTSPSPNTPPDNCTGHLANHHCPDHGTSTDQCNCPLVNLAYYVCDCAEAQHQLATTGQQQHICKPIEIRQHEEDKQLTINNNNGINCDQFETTQQLIEN